MIRYFFTVRDLHPLLLAGFSGALWPNPSLKLSPNGMARWAAGAKWAAGHAPDDQRDTPLVLRLSEGLGISAPEKPARSQG